MCRNISFFYFYFFLLHKKPIEECVKKVSFSHCVMYSQMREKERLKKTAIKILWWLSLGIWFEVHEKKNTNHQHFSQSICQTCRHVVARSFTSWDMTLLRVSLSVCMCICFFFLLCLPALIFNSILQRLNKTWCLNWKTLIAIEKSRRW